MARLSVSTTEALVTMTRKLLDQSRENAALAASSDARSLSKNPMFCTHMEPIDSFQATHLSNVLSISIHLLLHQCHIP
ncbi:hypothetical protein DdX_18190 [Ditylenchus destructor]|uniref:Uncharacterized protein n=1 Tax=Ditylenchus destructor TaxID=166010 RepID=A0AAD4QYI5_9BILA|nr:hypothetical protein DdX_18190 [Ditylenchus destructor]